MKHIGIIIFGTFLLSAIGCSTTPNKTDRTAFVAESDIVRQYFEANTVGLSQQIDHSAGYAVFPSVGQWGFLFGGGRFGRGVVNTPQDVQSGWAAVNTASIGIQAGVQDFKMLIVFEDAETFDRFKENRLEGAVAAVAVVGDEGMSTAATFTNGVAVYHGDSKGIMAGLNIGLDYLRYEPLD